MRWAIQRLAASTVCMLCAFAMLQAQPRTRAEFDQHRELQITTKQASGALSKTTAPAMPQHPAQRDFDVTYYGLHLRIDPNKEQLDGSVNMRARSTANELRELYLDFDANMSVTAVSGDAVGFTRQGNLLILQLGQPVARGATVQTRISYSGRPQSGGFGGFVFGGQNGQPLVWTLSEPYFARTWWPCKDTPADKADSVDIVVTVPDGLTAVSNGSLRRQQDNGDGTVTFHWHEQYPITTYLVSLAITNYATFTQWFRYSPTDSMAVRHYIYPTNLEAARQGLHDMIDMLRFFHDTFAPYPFLEEKYGVAQFGWGGGMEHQTISSQGSFYAALNAHELAHQWWGDMITNATWGDIWLNEGFASYSEALYFEAKLGRDYLHQYMSWMANDYRGSIFRSDTTSVGSIFNRIVYDKGAWVLHMLRHIAGDAEFFALLRAYATDQRFVHGNVTTAAFRQFCEEVLERDLGWFFDAWIYGTGRPHYRYAWQAVDAAGRCTVTLRIEQLQVPQHQLFAMPVDVAVAMPGADTTITVFVDQADQIVRFELAWCPTRIALDPENWILKYVEGDATGIGSDEAPLAGYALRQNYPNPFNGETRLEFVLPVASPVTLTIYDLRGAVVRRLLAQELSAGSHTTAWDGTDDSGNAMGSGLYVCRLQAGAFQQSRRLVYVK